MLSLSKHGVGFFNGLLTGVRRSGARPSWAPSSRSRVVLGICVEQPSNHSLVLRMVLARFGLEEIDAALAQSDRDLDALVAKGKILGRRKEVRNDP